VTDYSVAFVHSNEPLTSGLPPKISESTKVDASLSVLYFLCIFVNNIDNAGLFKRLAEVFSAYEVTTIRRYCYGPPQTAEALSDDACLTSACLSDVCLVRIASYHTPFQPVGLGICLWSEAGDL